MEKGKKLVAAGTIMRSCKPGIRQIKTQYSFGSPTIVQGHSVLNGKARRGHYVIVGQDNLH